tara:strand:+ start:759 stop:3116 length:2358 start_codon:yes stop_codon:yes gene_type:complete
MSTEFYNRNWRMPSSWNGSNNNNNKASNYSMSFDGTECIELNNGSFINPSSVISLSCWVNFNSLGNYDGIVGKRVGTSVDMPFMISLDNTSKIRFRIAQSDSTSKQILTDSTVNTGTWYNVIAVADGTNIKLYLNGQIQTDTESYDGTLLQDTSTNVFLAKNSTDKLDGKLDHVAIFDYALLQDDVNSLYGNSTNGVGNPMTLTPKPKAYYPIGDYAAFNGSEYLVNNGALQDYNFKINSANYNQGFIISEDYSYSAFTISMWINQTTNGRSIWFNKDTTGANTEKITISTNNNGFLVFNCSGGGDSYTLSTEHNLTGDDRLFTINRWINITAVYTGTEMILYGNADSGNFVSVSSSNYAAGGTVPSSITLTQNQTIIGKLTSGNSADEFKGQLSNFSVFDAALPETGTQSVTSLFNNGTPVNVSSYNNLKGFWAFDAQSTFDPTAGLVGSWTVPDLSANSNNAVSDTWTQWGNEFTRNNLVQSSLNITTPYSRFALSFDGGDYVDCTNSSTLNFERTDSFSASVWANFKVNGSALQLLGKQLNSSPYTGWAIQQITNYAIRVILINSGNNKLMGQTAQYAVSTTGWYHIAFTYDGSSSFSGIKLYINSSPTPISSYGQSNITATMQSSANFSIGARNVSPDAGVYFNGELSNASVWSSTLTPQEIKQLYNQGKPGNLKNHTAYSNLVSWWQLGENMSFVGSNSQGAGGTEWFVLDEKGSNNGISSNAGPAENAIVDGVGTSGNGLSDGMGVDNIVGEAPYSTANAVSYGMDVEARVSGTGNVPT